nr:hypothetical protein [Lichenihabitans psoromatis]
MQNQVHDEVCPFFHGKRRDRLPWSEGLSGATTQAPESDDEEPDIKTAPCAGVGTVVEKPHDGIVSRDRRVASQGRVVPVPRRPQMVFDNLMILSIAVDEEDHEGSQRGGRVARRRHNGFELRDPRVDHRLSGGCQQAFLVAEIIADESRRDASRFGHRFAGYIRGARRSKKRPGSFDQLASANIPFAPHRAPLNSLDHHPARPTRSRQCYGNRQQPTLFRPVKL